MTNGTKPFEMPQSVVEESLLASVNQKMDRWLEVSVFTEQDFSSSKAIFTFFGSYLQQYGSLPSSSQINSKFSWSPSIGDFAYWLAEMKRYALARRVLETLQEGYSRVNKPEEALSYLLEKLSLIRSQQSNHVQAYDASAVERLDKFDLRTEHILNAKQIVGIRTGLSVFDDTLIGYIPGSLVGCYSRPGVGKTWWLLWSGVNAWLDGKCVLAITPEMPANWLDLRIDVLTGQRLGYPIEYNKLIVGDPSIRDNYETITKILSQSSRWWTYDSISERSVGLSDVAVLIRQHRPDIVLIDGISLLGSTRRTTVWEQIHDLAYGLKNLATIYELPILVTHQAVNSAKGKRTEITMMGRGDDFIMPSLNDAAGGEDFNRACSDVITMCGEPTSQYINWYSLRKFRERGWQQPIAARMALAVNFGTGRIEDLGYLGYNPAAVGEEVRRRLGVL